MIVKLSEFEHSVTLTSRHIGSFISQMTSALWETEFFSPIHFFLSHTQIVACLLVVSFLFFFYFQSDKTWLCSV